MFLTSYLARPAIAALLLCAILAPRLAMAFSPGDPVRLKRSETLLFNGKNFLGAPKGQEFSVLQQTPGKPLVYVAFYKEDGTLIAVTLPLDALEPSPPDAWRELLRGVEAFRDQQPDLARRLLAAAAQDPQQKALATAIAGRVNAAIAARSAAKPAQAAAVQALRDTAEGLAKLGHLCLALPLDDAAGKLAAGGEGMPASKLDRDDVTKRVAISNRAVVRARQAMALHRTYEAGKMIEEGLTAEPARPELKAWQPAVKKDVTEGDERYEAADKMRKFHKGEVHALTAIEHGLKACADHPKLLALKREMSGAFELRTSPPVTPEFLAAAKVGTSSAVLTEGHKLYTTRCTECHDLELLDSRGKDGWQKAVGGMSRRAGLSEQEQARILDYIAAAQLAVEVLDTK